MLPPPPPQHGLSMKDMMREKLWESDSNCLHSVAVWSRVIFWYWYPSIIYHLGILKASVLLLYIVDKWSNSHLPPLSDYMKNCWNLKKFEENCRSQQTCSLFSSQSVWGWAVCTILQGQTHEQVLKNPHTHCRFYTSSFFLTVLI